jgi:hypothetical protein
MILATSLIVFLHGNLSFLFSLELQEHIPVPFAATYQVMSLS